MIMMMMMIIIMIIIMMIMMIITIILYQYHVILCTCAYVYVRTCMWVSVHPSHCLRLPLCIELGSWWWSDAKCNKNKLCSWFNVTSNFDPCSGIMPSRAYRNIFSIGHYKQRSNIKFIVSNNDIKWMAKWYWYMHVGVSSHKHCRVVCRD